ncbi:MAG: EthD domain-containing protein [Acidimicrobiia bacterium]
MIRLTAMLRRNPALSAAEFHAHWCDVHGPLVRSVPGVDRWVARYEQHPRVADRAGSWTGSEGFDGVAVQWFGSLDRVEAMIRDPGYRRIVGPDERHLLDLERSVYLLTDEPRVIIGGSSSDRSP